MLPLGDFCAKINLHLNHVITSTNKTCFQKNIKPYEKRRKTIARLREFLGAMTDVFNLLQITDNLFLINDAGECISLIKLS